MLRSRCKLFSIVLLLPTILVDCAHPEVVNDHEALILTRNQPPRIIDTQKLAKHAYLKLVSPVASACPAKTEEEQAFNNEHSFSKRSLFVRRIYDPPETLANIDYKICSTSYKMSVVYHTIGVEFQFGFEIYYDKDDFGLDSFIDSKRWHYDLITNTHSTANHIKPLYHYVPRQAAAIGSLVPPTLTRVASKLFPEEKLYLEDKSELGFMWAALFPLKFNFRAKRLAQTVYTIIQSTREVESCDNWDLGLEYYTQFGIPIADLYSEENQKRMLEGIKLPVKNHENDNEEDASCELETQCFTKWLSIPVEQLHFLATYPVSCSYLLTVPIWKSTIEDVLKKLDNFIYTVSKVIGAPPGIITIHSGAHGDLLLPTKAGNKKVIFKKITLGETGIPVPDVLYKLIKYKPVACALKSDKKKSLEEPKEVKESIESTIDNESNPAKDGVKSKPFDKNNELKEHPESEVKDKDAHLNEKIKQKADKVDDDLKELPEKDDPQEHLKSEVKSEDGQLKEKIKHKADEMDDKLKEHPEKDDPEEHPKKNGLQEHSEKDSTESEKYHENDHLLQSSPFNEPEKIFDCLSLESYIVVAIHNDPNFDPEKDKLCDDICSEWGWEEIQNQISNGRQFKSKFIYCCEASDAKVRTKLGLHNDEDTKDRDISVFNLKNVLAPQFGKLGFKSKDLRDIIVQQYKEIFEAAPPRKHESEEDIYAIESDNPMSKVFEIQKPNNDGNEPVKSETALVNDEEELENLSQKDEAK